MISPFLQFRNIYAAYNRAPFSRTLLQLSHGLFMNFALFHGHAQSFTATLPVPIHLFLFSVPIYFSSFQHTRRRVVTTLRNDTRRVSQAAINGLRFLT